MAKVKIKGVEAAAKKLSINLRVQVLKMFRNPLIRKQVGEIIIEDIKDNVNFKSPEEFTLKWRKRYDPLNKTDPKYSRNKLNATFTGELLEDLKNNVRADTKNLSFVVEHSNKKHKKYQGVTKKIGSRSKYSDISEGLVDKLGYDYFKLTDEARDKITKLVREELFKLLAQ